MRRPAKRSEAASPKCNVRTLCLAGVGLVAGLILSTVCASAADPPNIVLLMGDDHGWEETGYNGHPHVKTPALDAMAKTGLRLDHFYAAHPSCSPTRGSVLTGRHPNRFGTFAPGYSIRPEEITLAQQLHSVGYVCGHFGKWHLGPVKIESPTSPGAMGFDQFVSHDNFFELNPLLSTNGGPPERHVGESSAVVVGAAKKFITQALRSDQPFLAVVWFGSPHEPYSGLPQDLAMYDNLPDSYAKRQVRLTSNTTGLQVQRSLRDVLCERLAEITAMDRAIAELQDFLTERGLKENTVVWYCGDNGTPRSGLVASPFRGMKGQMFEGGIRVPGIIQWPAKVKSRHTALNTVTSDIFPTVCELAGVGLPDRPYDGVSLAPLLKGSMTERGKPLYFWSYDTRKESQAKREPYLAAELQQGTTPLVKLSGGLRTRNFKNFRHPMIESWNYSGERVVIDGRHKLLVRGDEASERVELYDLAADPAETSNVASANGVVVKRLQRELRNWQKSVLESLTGADYK